MKVSNRGTLAVLAFALVAPSASDAQTAGSSIEADAAELVRIHDTLIRAHVEARPDLWLSLESDDFVSINGGSVTFPSIDERRAQRTDYLENATFRTYRDVREPIVRIADDGTLGWLIAEVEIEGSFALPDGSSVDFHDVYAWIELYERSADGWTLVGNASNRRDP